MKKIACILLLAAAFASPATAQDSKYSLSLMSGVSLPVSGIWASDPSHSGNYDYGRSGSFSSAIAADYKINDYAALGFEIGRNWAHSPQKLYNLDGEDTHIWQFTPYAKVFRKFDKFTPYGILGVGLYSVTVDDLTDMAGAVVREGFTKNYPGVNIGGGVTYALSSNWEIGFDARWHHIFSNISEYSYDTDGIVQIAANNITTLLKLQYNF